MLILNQDKDLCADMTGSSVYVSVSDDGESVAMCLCGNSAKNIHALLGRYNSKERAKEILLDIVRKYESLGNSDGTAVFCMPEE